MDEVNKDKNELGTKYENEEKGDILATNLSDIDNVKNKNVINRISSLYGRTTTDSAVYEISYESEHEDDVVDFFEQNRNSLNIKDVYQEKQLEKNNEDDEDIISDNINSKGKIFLIVDQDDESTFQEGFQKLSKEQEFDLKPIKVKTIVRSISDEDKKDKKDKKNKEVKLTEVDKIVINSLLREKYWILELLTIEEQKNIIHKLVQLGKNDYQKQREEIFGVAKSDEYQFMLDSVFNSGRLTMEALIELNNFLCPKEISSKNIGEEIKLIWDNIFTRLADRDIIGKKDRMKAMIGPRFQAEIVGRYIKLAQALRDEGLLKDGQNQQIFHSYIIYNAKRRYSKLNKEFWLHFLFDVLGFSLLMTLVGVILTTLLSLSGLAQFAACAVLLVTSLISTGYKFHEYFMHFPWEWIYWWKDARDKCLEFLMSLYIQEIVRCGITKKLNKSLPKKTLLGRQNKLNNKKNLNLNKLDLDREKKNTKNRRKRYGFLFWLVLVAFIAAVLTWYFPAVVAKAIALVLTVFKLELTLTIPAIVSSIAFWVGIVALVATVVFYIKYKNNRDAYLQKKFDLYQQNICKNGDKYFMRFKKDEDKMWYTREELEKAGIKVNDQPDIG